MPKRTDSWSGNWCIDKLREIDEIDSIELTASNFLSIMHKDVGRLNLATMSLSWIDVQDIDELLIDKHVDFVLNVSNEPYITQSALEYAERENFAIGGMGDAMRVLRSGYTESYINPEIQFILQGLRQHTRVSHVIRLDNRRFQVDRYGLPTVCVLALNEYELTAEAVRNAIDHFPEFQAILKSNPNGGISDNSLVAASFAGIKIFRWGELLSMLNRDW